MQPDETAQFSELLDLRVDIPGFEASLAAAKAAWLSFVADLGSNAGNAIGAGSFDGLREELHSLIEVVTVTNAEMLSLSQATASGIQTIVGQTAEKQEQAAQKQRERAAKTAAVEIDSAKQVAAQLDDQLALITTKRELADDLVKTTPAQRFGQDIGNEQEGVIEANYAATDKLIELAEKRADVAAKIDREILEGEQATLEQQLEANYAYTDRLIELAEKRADAALGTHRNIVSEQQGILDQELEANYAYTDKLIALAEKRADVAAGVDREILEGEQAVLEQVVEANYIATDKLIALAEKRADASLRTHREIISEQQGLADPEPKMLDLAVSPASIARLAQFILLWRVFGGVLNGITVAIEAPFKAIISGIEYMRELEATADELTGVLDANVKFSDNLVENFQRAAKVAPEVAKALQDAAINAQIKPEQLTNIFKALANNGATAGVKDLTQLVDLATMYGMALKASGASAQSVQRAVGEIPKAMEGNLAPTSKWLQVLGLTNDQWVSLRNEGLKYHDLVERIGNLPSMKAHINALEQMEGHQKDALETLGLIIKRLEAHAASGLYDEVSKWLKQLNEWVVKNEDKLTEGLRSLADVLGNLVNSIIKLLQVFGEVPALSAGIKLLLTSFQGVSVAVGAIAANAKLAISTLKELATWEFHPVTSAENVKKAWAEWKHDQADIADQTYKTLNDIWGKQPGVAPPSGLLDAPIGNKSNNRQDTNAKIGSFKQQFDVDKAEFMETVEAVKETYRSLNNATTESVAARTLSHAHAAEEIKRHVEQEIEELNRGKAALDADAAVARQRIVNSPSVTKDERDKQSSALASFDKEQASFATSWAKMIFGLRQAEHVAEVAANNESEQINKEHWKFMIAVREDAAKRDLAITKFQAQEGYITQLEAFDKETDLLKQERQIKVEQDNARLNEFPDKTVKEYLDLLDKKNRAEQQYFNEDQIRAQERKGAAERDRLDTMRAGDQARAAQLEARRLAVGIASGASTVGPDLSGEDALFEAKQRELSLLIREKEALLEIAAAKNAESEQTRRLSAEVHSLYNERLREVSARMAQLTQRVPDETLRSIITLPVIQQGVNSAQQNVGDSANRLNRFDDQHGNVSDDAELFAAREALVSQLKLSEDELTKWNSVLAESVPTFDQALESLATKLFGFDPFTAWKQARQNDINNGGGFTGHDSEIAVGAKAVAGAFKSVADAAKVYQQGHDAGGVLGGAGALAGQFSGIAELIAPGIGGAVVSAVGSIMQTIGGLFTAAARHIAEDIQKDTARVMQAYTLQQADLVQTIESLQRERLSAISRLSGAKGGQDQLDKILPGLDSQISSLQQQATKTVADFNYMAENLVLQNDTLSQINQQWASINQQVADYLSAGGSAVTAEQALSATLQKMQTEAQQSLNQGNEQAVQDAIQLNGLLQQRVDLTEQYNAQVFSVVNQGSIQRRAGAVTQGEQLSQLAAQYAKQIQDLDSQISLTNQKVEAEGKVFSIASDINMLHAEDADFQLKALDEQLQKYLTLKDIVAGITHDASGVFSSAPALFNQLPTTINIALNLAGYTLTATGQVAPGASTPISNNGGSLSDGLEWQLRQMGN